MPMKESGEVVRVPDRREFAESSFFLTVYTGFADFLADAEKNLRTLHREDKDAWTNTTRTRMEILRTILSSGEFDLIDQTFDLFGLKNSLPPFNRIPEIGELALGKGRQELTVEIAGPIASGKTTIGNFLAKGVNAQKNSEGFTPEENPFLAPSYQDPFLMFRTQLKFLLDNINGGLRSKYQEGRWIRDTSVWSDIYIFMEWRRRMGKVTTEEYEAYMDTVSLLEPLI